MIRVIKFFSLFCLFVFSSSYLWAEIDPFDVKVLHETEMTLTEYDKTGPQYGARHVFILKKGVHVKVLQRGGYSDVGYLRVKLDDGSIGWIPSEAVCDSAEVVIHPNDAFNGFSYKITYRIGEKCWPYYGQFRTSRDVMFPLYDEDGDPMKVPASKLSTNTYLHICADILKRNLPEAYRQLPVYPRTYKTFYTIGVKPENIERLCGYSKEEIDAMFGEPEGFAGPGLSNFSGYTIAYYERYIPSEHVKDFPGLLVAYDKLGIARAVDDYSYLHIDNTSSIKVEKLQLEKKSDANASLKKKFSATTNKFTAYRDTYTSPDQTYGVPKIMPEQGKVKAKKNGLVTENADHSAGESLFLFLPFLMVAGIATLILSKHPRNWNRWARRFVLILITAPLLPVSGFFAGPILMDWIFLVLSVAILAFCLSQIRNGSIATRVVSKSIPSSDSISDSVSTSTSALRPSPSLPKDEVDNQFSKWLTQGYEELNRYFEADKQSHTTLDDVMRKKWGSMFDEVSLPKKGEHGWYEKRFELLMKRKSR